MTREARLVDPATDGGWAELAARAGSLFESPPWLAAVTEAMGVRAQASVLEDGGRPVAGLAAGLVGDAVGTRRSTFPFSDYCDPIGAVDGAAWDALAEPFVDPAMPWSLRMRRAVHALDDPRFEERGRYAWHEIDLRGTCEERWGRLAPGARQNVRHARRAGVRTEVSPGLAAVEEFRTLHRALRRTKFGMLAQPPEYFAALHRHFSPEALAVVSAHHDGRMIAGILLLRWRERAYYKFNASLPEVASPLRANDALLWAAMEHAAGAWGATALDLGLSDLDQPGLLRYKRKFATAEAELVSVSTGPRPDERSQRARRLVDDLTRLAVEEPGVPAAVLDRMSSLLYRHFC